MYEGARRLRPLDRVLIATLVPFFLLVLALQLREGLATGGMQDILVRVSSAPADGFPVVEALFSPQIEGGSLEVGDRIAKLDNRSLLGVSMFEFSARATLAARRPEGAHIEVVRGEERFRATLFASSRQIWWLAFPQAVFAAATALILFLRAPQWPCARAYFVSSLCVGVFSVCARAPPAVDRPACLRPAGLGRGGPGATHRRPCALSERPGADGALGRAPGDAPPPPSHS